jgi:hypothetical protein
VGAVEVEELCKTYARRLAALRVLYGAKIKSLAPAKRGHTTILELKKCPALGVERVHNGVSEMEVMVSRLYARSVPLESPVYSSAGLEPNAKVATGAEAPFVVCRVFPIEPADRVT